MLALFVMAVPCVGVIMIVIWALVGENESRKNFFRAVIAWALIGVVFWMGMMLLGLGAGNFEGLRGVVAAAAAVRTPAKPMAGA